MSYCRWSSDDWTCDLYCYADCAGGFTTHVAGNRQVGEAPKLPPLTKDTVDAYAKAHSEQMTWLENCERRRIELPHAGETFNDPDLSSFLARVESLKALGYNVPDYVLTQIREEMQGAPEKA